MIATAKPRRRAARPAIRALLCSTALLLGALAARRPAAAGEEPPPLRLAVFNVRELSAAKLGDVDAAGHGRDPQLLAAAAIVRRIRPDVLLVQEIDLGGAEPGAAADANARRFVARYLAAPGGGEPAAEPIDFPYVFAGPSNTGELAGLDLNGDGRTASAADLGTRQYGEDSFGFGTYPGQYAMALLSRLPIDREGIRTFRRFLWRDLPGNHMPAGFYPPAAEASLRLSSKSHQDVPLLVGERRLHLWISHPTPSVFDGEEDRNGRRNLDEIAFWVHYAEGDDALYDDDGGRGGYAAGEPFVIVGDLNARPEAEPVYDGRSNIARLLELPLVLDPPPLRGRPTAVFGGGMRIDYLLPSRDLTVVGGGVFWPSPATDPAGAALAETASDHRLVWLDLERPTDAP